VPNDFLRGYLPFLLQRADQELSAAFHARLGDDGISVSEWRLLAVLGDGRPYGVSELATVTMLPQPTTTHAIGRLESDGLVERRSDDHDKRRRLVSLTPAGLQLAARLTAAAAHHQAAVLATIDAEIGPALQTQLGRLIDTDSTSRSPVPPPG
jgi:DNA-binding MarR family transcriptional regulator